MLSTIGFFLFIIAGINAAWVGLFALLSWSGQVGAKISKKVGTANDNTDQYIEQGKSFSKELLTKLSWRLALTLIGYLMYTFGT
jgi:hypothetical protein